MAEDSLLWDGTTTGHAASTDIWNAPYSSAEMSDLFSTLLGSDVAKGFVIPGFGNDLKVQANSPVALNVVVKSGRLMVRGRLYGNTSDNTLTIGAADATNPRLDRIVARISFAAQTLTLAVLAGTAAATPSLPALTQNTTTYEISLAYVWVAATATTLADTEIHDERVFAANLESILGTIHQSNLLRNSEFMAFSQGSGTHCADLWELVLTPSNFQVATKPAAMSRGRAIQITADAANEGMYQRIYVKPSTTYVIKGLVNVTAGDVGVVKITTNSASPNTITRNIRRTGAWIEELIYYTTESDATYLDLSLLCLSNTDIVKFGQFLLVEGYIPGTFRQIRELIMFSENGVVAANIGAESSGAQTITCQTEWPNHVPEGTIGIVVNMQTTGATVNTGVLLRTLVGDAGLVVYSLSATLPNSGQGETPINFAGQCELFLQSNMTVSIMLCGIRV